MNEPAPTDPLSLDADVLLLDAGNTLVFLDPDVAAATLRQAGLGLPSEALATAMGAAHRGYAERLTGGGSHEDGWRTFMATWLEAAGLAPPNVPAAIDHLRREHDRFNLWRRLPGDVKPALARAHDVGLRLGIISNSEGQLLALLGMLRLEWPAGPAGLYVGETLAALRVFLQEPRLSLLSCAGYGEVDAWVLLQLLPLMQAAALALRFAFGYVLLRTRARRKFSRGGPVGGAPPVEANG